LRQHDNSFFGDPVLFQRTSAIHAPLLPEFSELGAYAAGTIAQERARLAHRHVPLLYTHDNFGMKCEGVDLHPAYHSLLTRARHAGIASSLFDNKEEAPVRHQARSIRLFLLAGIETGCLQQLCVSSAGFAALHAQQKLLGLWQNFLSSPIHDPSSKPYAQKQGALLSWATVEHQTAKSAAHLPQTRGIRVNELEEATTITARLYGEKAAVINPMADAFLVNATFEGQDCLFLLPRLLDDGRVNGISLAALVHEGVVPSCPQGDMRFNSSLGFMVGSLSDAPRLMGQMQDALQFDHAVMSVAGARRLLRLAIDQMRHEASHASSQPQYGQKAVMRARLYADAALDCTAATLLVLRLARALDLAEKEQEEAYLASLLLPVCGFWVPHIAAQITDCVATGSEMAHIASGSLLDRNRRYLARNRTLERSPLDMLSTCVATLQQSETYFNTLVDTITANIGSIGQHVGELLHLSAQMSKEDASFSCFLVEQLAYAVAACSMQEFEADVVTTAFINSRLGGQWRATYGMLNPRFNPTFILETLFPSA